ncbi:MAG: TonB-dependent receptor [Saprospiraceae bacterium]|nr:TonB-dependent receptor [Saprospiraceae bacterium]
MENQDFSGLLTHSSFNTCLTTTLKFMFHYDIVRYKYLVLIGFLLVSIIGKAQTTIGKDDGKNGPHTITVYVNDAEDKSQLIGANVIVKENGEGDITNERGRTRLNLTSGNYTLEVSYLGYETKEEKIVVLGKGTIRIKLTQSAETLEEVIISSEGADQNVRNTDLGKQVMSIATIEALPPFVGEADILKSITLLPGVSSVGEASAGFNVRGSNADQNLILLGGAPLYNPSHLFGFFSAFNTDLIQDISIYKGGIPANYGGRASSIIDLRYKRGDQDNWGGKASLGLVSAKASLSGPVFTEDLTVMVAGRSSYSNWILNAVNDAAVSNSSANFYDLNAIVDYDIADDFSVRYAFYRSNDDFSLASDTSFTWSNQNHTISLDKNFGEKFKIELSAVDASYNFGIVDNSPFSNFTIDSKIKDQGLNFAAKYFVADNHDISIGAQTKLIKIQPGDLNRVNPESPIEPFSVKNEKAMESGIFAQHNFELTKYLGVSYGLRYNTFRFLGPNQVPVYDPLLPRNEENILSFTEYGDNDLITDYSGFEPRASLRLSMTESFSLKFGYNKMYQYIHLISSTTTIAPTDVWKLSDTYLKPQEVTQYSGGLFKNFNNNSIEASVEVFYKDLQNILDYKDGATLILNNNLESDLLNGIGRAYGVELYLEKKTGNFTGWLSYTYSRSERKVVGSFPEEIINDGDWYASNFDKPHSLSIVGDYKLGKRTKVSSIFTYSTGRPTTYPEAKFNYQNGTNIAYYDNRNTFRVPDYHRLDLSLTFGWDTENKWLSGDWVLSLYNVYGRKNAFSVFFDDIPGSPPQAFRLSVLGIPFPSLSYNFEF